MPRLLILYATHDGHTAQIAHAIGEVARYAAWAPDIWPCQDLPRDFTLAPYQAAIVAAPIIAGCYPGAVRKAVRSHCAALTALPTAFLSVSWGATEQPWAPKPVQRQLANTQFFRQTGWRPTQLIEAGGAVLYTRHAWPLRWLWSLFIRRAGGPHDLSRDYDFTDWRALHREAQQFLAHAAQLLPVAS
jgi:menaquinone-dependent protoporphyrinogen oxidase